MEFKEVCHILVYAGGGERGRLVIRPRASGEDIEFHPVVVCGRSAKFSEPSRSVAKQRLANKMLPHFIGV